MSGLPREVLKWLQSLDLTWQLKTPKWDLTNGYLVAEIFSWYYPQELQMHMYNNGTSLESKLKNWSLLQIFFRRHKVDIPMEYVEGTIHCKEGAAPLLITHIYELLTNRQAQLQDETAIDFTDRAYQEKLPVHARSTASQAVKNNLRITELMADRNIILGQQKAQTIITRHINHRLQERQEDPERFERKPTLGELAVRRPPEGVGSAQESGSDVGAEEEDAPMGEKQTTFTKETNKAPDESSYYKEVKVKQLGKTSPYQQSVQTY